MAWALTQLASNAGRWRPCFSSTLALFLFIILVTILFISPCTSSDVKLVNRSTNNSELVALFVYPTPIDDFGYSYSADIGRAESELSLIEAGYTVYTNYLQNLNSSACVEIVSETLLSGLKGMPYDAIFFFGEQFDGCISTLESSPGLGNFKMISIGGRYLSARTAIVTPKIYEGRYLQGVLCALATTSQQVGIVAAVPISNNVMSQNVNAFTLGVKSVNPDIQVKIVITGTFLDVVTETKATKDLIHSGCDCIAAQQNDLTVHYVASPLGVYSMGYASDARFFAGEQVLSSILYNWTPQLSVFMTQLLTNSWSPHQILWLGLNSTLVQMSGFSTLVLPEWRATVEHVKDSFNDGFNPFCTPAYNDPQYLSVPNYTYTTTNGTICLNSQGISVMLGIYNAATVLEVFDANHSAYQTVYVSFSSTGAIILMIICSILLLACIIAFIDVIKNREAPPYKAASPLFLGMILIGLTLTSISPYFWIGPRTKANCMLQWWFLGIGHSLVYSCLFAKNYRIWKIFTSGHFKIVAIFNHELLLKWVAAILGVEVVLLALWTGIAPLVPISSQNLDYFPADQIQQLCKSIGTRFSTGLILFVLYNAALLAPTAVVSYWTRTAKEEYRESSYIAAVVYFTLVMILIMVGIYIAVLDNYLVNFYIEAYGVCIVNVSVFTILVLPKSYRTHIYYTSSMDSGQKVSELVSQPAFDSALRRGGSRPHGSLPPSLEHVSREEVVHHRNINPNHEEQEEEAEEENRNNE